MNRHCKGESYRIVKGVTPIEPLKFRFFVIFKHFNINYYKLRVVRKRKYVKGHFAQMIMVISAKHLLPKPFYVLGQSSVSNLESKASSSEYQAP